MASVEQPTQAETNGIAAGDTIAVENPATGQLITTVPVLGAEELAPMAARAREAQPQWEAIGFEGRGRIMRRAQKWMLDNADRVLQTVVDESGKTHEDAQVADFGYTVAARIPFRSGTTSARRCTGPGLPAAACSSCWTTPQTRTRSDRCYPARPAAWPW